MSTRITPTRPTLALQHFDVVIIGAGLAGCATAAALHRADPDNKRKILLVDKCKGVHPQFAGEFIHPKGAQILDDLGFHAPLRAAGAIDVDGFAVFEHADAHLIDLSYREVTNERPRGLAVHHKTLVRTMRQVVRERGDAELREGWSLLDLVRDPKGQITGVVLQDPNRQPFTISTDLVVGADGKRSTTRKLAKLSDERGETVGFTAGVGVINATLPRPNYGHVMLGAWGPILAYPIQREANGDILSRVIFDLPKDLPAKGEKVKDYLLQAFVPFMPAPLNEQVAAAIMAHKGTLPMAPTVTLPAPRAVAPGLALVGDASGCSHPVTASGMTMCLRDAATLGEQAARAVNVPADKIWIGRDALRQYRTTHDRYVPTRQALADAIYEAFRGNDEGARAIRRALFGYWESGPAARRRSMSLLSCSEARASVFLTEYLKTARHALQTSLQPRHADNLPVADRMRQARGAARLARTKLGLVAQVMWAQVRPSWLPRAESRL